ncbi:MBL fold metallo-hydrolase [Sulfitobacter porphyrae]|uniref:MBL fold metallo-hydrolase n=1 Tax=Sulfitobacter porphyrae TaxID=1246864 RepID=A0ABW2B7C5_9RHOB
MLDFPYNTPPQPGEVITVRPGLLWARLSLPFRLDHVNVYFIEDENGWIIVDTGIDNRTCRGQWQDLLNGPLKGVRFGGLLVTHHHPDHIGLAGWLCDTLGIPLLTGRTTFLSAMNFYNSPEILAATAYSRFYASHGMPPRSPHWSVHRARNTCACCPNHPLPIGNCLTAMCCILAGGGFRFWRVAGIARNP